MILASSFLTILIVSSDNVYKDIDVISILAQASLDVTTPASKLTKIVITTIIAIKLPLKLRFNQ